MALILNIDTATESAVVSISENDKVLASAINNEQKDHASFLQPAIREILQKAGLSINELKAVAVTAGPGSYTGLRVGMASAKGLCYALNIPLILINTLEAMALSAIWEVKDQSALYCPMIDARRMEVFTGVYDHSLKEIRESSSMIVDENSFNNLLQNNTMYFTGSGSLKLRNITQNLNAQFLSTGLGPDPQSRLSWKKYEKQEFANLFYSSPQYLKEFYTLNKNG